MISTEMLMVKIIERRDHASIKLSTGMYHFTGPFRHQVGAGVHSHSNLSWQFIPTPLFRNPEHFICVLAKNTADIKQFLIIIWIDIAMAFGVK